MFHDMLTIRSAVYVLIKYFNPLMPGGNKRSHILYLNKPAVER